MSRSLAQRLLRRNTPPSLTPQILGDIIGNYHYELGYTKHKSTNVTWIITVYYSKFTYDTMHDVFKLYSRNSILLWCEVWKQIQIQSIHLSISATLRDALHWLPIRQRVEFKLSVLVFNCMHNLAPSYLSTMCQPVANNAGRRHLHSAARGDLAVPATRMLRYGPRSFAVAGPSTWNSLPAPLRSCHLISAFRRDLKTELFTRAYQ